MTRIAVTVVGEGPLATWHRQVFARHVACELLPDGLPDRGGFVDLCGPAEACSEAIGAAVRARVPLVLSLPTQWRPDDLAKLANAAHKHRLPVVAVGSLRLFPAVARLKEIVSTGALGTLRAVRLQRQGTDVHPATGEPNADLAAWRDADVCQWLRADQPTCECGCESVDGPTVAERQIHVLGELGELDLRFVAGQTPDLAVRFGSTQRTLRVPALGSEAAHLAELQVVVAARQHGQPWLVLPALAEVVASHASR